MQRLRRVLRERAVPDRRVGEPPRRGRMRSARLARGRGGLPLQPDRRTGRMVASAAARRCAVAVARGTALRGGRIRMRLQSGGPAGRVSRRRQGAWPQRRRWPQVAVLEPQCTDTRSVAAPALRRRRARRHTLWTMPPGCAIRRAAAAADQRVMISRYIGASRASSLFCARKSMPCASIDACSSSTCARLSARVIPRSACEARIESPS